MVFSPVDFGRECLGFATPAAGVIFARPTEEALGDRRTVFTGVRVVADRGLEPGVLLRTGLMDLKGVVVVVVVARKVRVGVVVLSFCSVVKGVGDLPRSGVLTVAAFLVKVLTGNVVVVDFLAVGDFFSGVLFRISCNLCCCESENIETRSDTEFLFLTTSGVLALFLELLVVSDCVLVERELVGRVRTRFSGTLERVPAVLRAVAAVAPFNRSVFFSGVSFPTSLS